MPDMKPSILAMRDRITVVRFIGWLYDHGPDPNSMPREALIAAWDDYLVSLEGKVIQFKGKETDEGL